MLSFLLQAQNLVFNGGFELFEKCPGSWNEQFYREVLPGWTSANYGTPDYFHICSTGPAKVPVSWAGRAEPYEGDGYVGIFTYLTIRPDYREYLQTELTQALEAGKEYWIEFYYRLSEYSAYAVDRIGLHLSDSAIMVKHDRSLGIQPVLNIIKKEALDLRTGEWEKAWMRYTANGGERFLIIGNFYSNTKTEAYLIKHRKGMVNPMIETGAYYFIDAVKVMPMDSLIAVVERERIPEKIKTGETYVLRNIQFAFDSYELLPASFTELNRLAEIMKSQLHLKIKLDGHTDDQGTDAYNMNLSARRAGSVANYLIRQGIDASRISFEGFGKRLLLVNEKSESARAMNRRVEVTFLD
ncbi:MAG TPA: OmpA family protein [Cyclobacteriaceae bacterium]|nr:OmpA family protein [Cyclobacteriaceae bacterium]